MPPHHRGWMYPPTRRELTLLLFSLTVFVISYNLETSLQLVGLPSTKLSSSYLSIGIGTQDPGFDPDGRRPKGWRDELESIIFGEWAWDEGKVADVERGHVGLVGNAAIYNADSGGTVSRSAGKDDRGVGVTQGVSSHEQFIRWGDDVPRAKVVAHVPGYTILDNLIVVNGTFFLVTDDPSTIPDLSAIASSAADHTRPPREQDWQVLSTQEAGTKLGTFGGRIFGTTWLSLDSANSQDPYTLFSLFRTHSTLADPPPSASSEQSSTGSNVPAPLRLIFPHVPTFSSPHIPPEGEDIKIHPPPRIKSYNGLHPLITKAALPTVGIWYLEDWKDIVDMNAPWIFDRVVIADRGAAERGRDLWTRRWTPSGTPNSGGNELKRQAEAEDSKPAWAAPFVGLQAPQGWWAPMRSALLSYLRLSDSRSDSGSGSMWGRKSKAPATKPVVTYVSMQSEPRGAGLRLRDEDHLALLVGLRALQKEGVLSEVHVVKGNGSVDVHGWEWADRMSAIAKSSIVLGPHGFHLADSIFMAPHSWSTATSPLSSHIEQNPLPAPLLMEFFPPGTFVRDQEYAVRSLGIRYMAWWNDRKLTGNSLPPVIRPDEFVDSEQRLSISADAILQSIREEVAQRRVP